MRTVLGFILILVALTTLGQAAEPTTAPTTVPADAPSPYQLRVCLPDEMPPLHSAYPLTIEVRNGGDTPLVFAHRVASSSLSELGARKLPEGACLVVAVEPRSKPYGGSTAGSPRVPGHRTTTVEPGTTVRVSGQVSPRDLRAPVVRFRALLMIDGKQVAASAWTDDVTVYKGQPKKQEGK